MSTQLLEVCNRTLNGDRSDIWAKSGIVPIPKKGNLGDTGNYRGTSLNVIAAKIYNKMILNRIRPHLNDESKWVSIWKINFGPNSSTEKINRGN